MNYVAHIIDRFGGIRPMAAAIGKPVSTVQSWKVRGSIPDHVKPAILERANSCGIDLRPDHFFPAASEPKGDVA